MRFDKGKIIKRSGRWLLAACLATGVAMPGFSQVDVIGMDPEEDAAPERYTVELVIFEYTNSALSGNEQFLPKDLPAQRETGSMDLLTFGDPGSFYEPDMGLATDDADGVDDGSDMPQGDQPIVDEELEEIPSHIIQTRLEVLDPETHAMPDIYRQLVALDAYRPIMRAAWTQATYEEEQTLPINLRRLGNAPLRLDGTLMLYSSRFLHFVVDLTIESREEVLQNRDDDDARYYGDRWSSTRYGFGYEAQTVPIRYTISEDRIFRNGQIRYYDHPKFGVLARVTRIEEESPETDDLLLTPADPTGAPSASIR